VSGPCAEHVRDPGACAGVSRDPGASAIRTRLAWRRTGLSAAAVGLLAIRPAFRPGAGPAEWLVAAAAMVTWAAIIGIAMHRSAELRTRFPGPAQRAIRAYTVLVAALAVLGCWVVTL
jgi:hypothetical protein